MGPSVFREERHNADIAVIGGGMAGLCAALAAARHGAQVALMHDRPVLGGNASSEMRMHICGADRYHQIPLLRETGILEELRLANQRFNPHWNYSLWDLVLYEAAQQQPNLRLLLNCSCQDATMDGSRITSAKGWQLTTQTFHTVTAKIFIDCSGDAILAPLSGAEFRVGREARAEYGESIAPEQADQHTMGMTCLFQTREYDSPQSFDPPAWIERFEKDSDLPYGAKGHEFWGMGYWWIELGGEHDSIHDTEKLRHELLKIALGVWDHIKNRGDHGAANWALDWLQFLPAKRESRRYRGEHVLCQGDIEGGGQFDDLVAYGGWPMDDHHPAGFRAVKLGAPATIFHPAPSPYGIPYRALYSRNVANLMFSGRCASCTHAAMSSTRVMGTACSMGQAAGAAAALAALRGVEPRGLLPYIRELQQALLWDDCYLPGLALRAPALTAQARLTASQGNPEPVRDGIHRPVKGDFHSWKARVGDSITYEFSAPEEVREVALILDSALDRNIIMTRHVPVGKQLRTVPPPLPKEFRIEGFIAGKWQTLQHVTGNYQRLVRVPIGRRLEGVRLVLDATWGEKESHIYGFYGR
ncbi:MAG: FAD-dependent oxidoreductase [Lentisphaerae bacterium]|nr:FAD-dependent oxidoreductase [Lentisphaerota bacterium]